MQQIQELEYFKEIIKVTNFFAYVFEGRGIDPIIKKINMKKNNRGLEINILAK